MNIHFLENKILTLCSSLEKPLIILGLSGGPDSVFLFHLLNNMVKKKQISLIAAHLDHEWRENSFNDSEWCKQLCESYSIHFISKKASEITISKKYNGSKEELGRFLRRSFFENLQKEYQSDAIALGHHAQDQEETFFIRMIRGSSLDGLCAMKEKEGFYIRPLLSIAKSEILDYLKSNQFSYLIDSTNESDSFLRNRIRKEIIPSFEKVDNRFHEKFKDTLESLKQENEFLEKTTQETFDIIFTNDIYSQTLKGNLSAFRKAHPVLQKRILILLFIKEKLSFTPSGSFLQEILRFLSSGAGGHHILSSSWKLIKKNKSFFIEKIKER